MAASTAAAVEHLKSSDPKLSKLIARVGPPGFKIRRSHTPFSALARSIIFQQLNGRAAETIHLRVKAACGCEKQLAPDHILGTKAEELRAAGLSKAKLLALLDLATKAKEGIVPERLQLRRMSDEELIERLTAVRGIGVWTVQMFLMFCLGRPDVLALGDYGLRRGFTITFGLKELATPEQMERRAKRWRPYRSLASWYLWRAAELADKEKKK